MPYHHSKHRNALAVCDDGLKELKAKRLRKKNRKVEKVVDYVIKRVKRLTKEKREREREKETCHLLIIDMAGRASFVATSFYDLGYDSEIESLDNNLDFSQTKFYGRNAELQVLHSIYNKVCNPQQAAGTGTPASREVPIPLIAGYSGSGKSALVHQFVHEINNQSKPCFFLAGKYDEVQRTDPFSAIVQAISGFASFLIERDVYELEIEGEVTDLKRVREDITKAIGAQEVTVLTKMVPDLAKVFGTSTTDPPDQGDASCGSEENGWNRLKYVFHTFFKAICTEHRPVVMFLDDLQWADSDSLDLIFTLMKDKSIRHFMFVIAIRSTEVDKDHPLLRRLKSLEKVRQIERIDLLNLSMGEMGEFVADSLDLKTTETKDLTEAIYSKTRGNIFWVKQTLQELHRNNVLYYCTIFFRWQWTIEGVELESKLPDNMLEVVVSKIQSAPEKLQTALVVAAYTRSSVDVDTLQTLIMRIKGHILIYDELVKILDLAVLEGLLSNTFGSQDYKFAHHRIQEAAYSLVPAGQERDKFRLMIGKLLVELGSSVGGEDWMLFVGADHLDSISSDGLDPLFMARVNLDVGEKAVRVAAFSPAATYLKKGLDALKQIPSHWQDHYDLSLRLYRNMADVELFLGNFDLGDELGKQVFENAEKDRDKLPTYMSLSLALGRQERHAEALALNRTALSLLGEYRARFQAVHMVKDQAWVKKFFSKNSDSKILLLPKMKDEAMLITMRFLSECSLRAFYCGNFVEFMLNILRGVRMSFKYGLCGETAGAIMGYAIVLGSLGDQEGATRLSRLARAILDTTKAKHMDAKVLIWVALFVDAWSEPHTEVLQTLQRGLTSGMETGDIENGFLSWLTANRYAYGAGYPLDVVEKAGAELVEQLQLYKVDSLLSILLEQRKPIRYLTGRTNTPLNWETLENFGSSLTDSSETFRLIFGYMARLELAVYFGEFSFAERMAEKLQELSFHDSSYLSTIFRLFYSGLTASCLERQTGMRKYRSKARKLANEMKRLIKTRGRNSYHRYLLMEADLKASSRFKPNKIRAAYDEAVYAAVKAGYTQDAALGSELAGEYFLSIGDESLAGGYLTQSRNLYREWGAKAKVVHLQIRRGRNLDALKSTSPSINWITIDTTEWRHSVDLDLLSGQCPRTKVPMLEGKEHDEMPRQTEHSEEAKAIIVTQNQ
jgi:predicted ATPase